MRTKEIQSKVLCPLAMKVASIWCMIDPEDEMNDVYMAK
jgi:hypothetical protein